MLVKFTSHRSLPISKQLLVTLAAAYSNGRSIMDPSTRVATNHSVFFYVMLLLILLFLARYVGLAIAGWCQRRVLRKQKEKEDRTISEACSALEDLCDALGDLQDLDGPGDINFIPAVKGRKDPEDPLDRRYH